MLYKKVLFICLFFGGILSTYGRRGRKYNDDIYKKEITEDNERVYKSYNITEDNKRVYKSYNSTEDNKRVYKKKQNKNKNRMRKYLGELVI